jgi:excisionase family DNA binding protein
MSRQKKISMVQPLLLTVPDVAVRLAVSRATVYRYIYHEGLPTMLLRGVRRVHPDSLEQWLKAHEDCCA